MTERLTAPNDPFASFPHLQGEQASGHFDNLWFSAEILNGFDTVERGPLHTVTVVAMARCLDEVDRLYGSGTDNLGAGYHTDPWAEKSLPAFYHNGLRTKVAIADTATYMHWANQQALEAGKSLPYTDAKTIYGTLLAAAFDDLVFKGERGLDEDASREVARDYLTFSGAPAELVEAVDVAIDASKFNEAKGQQAFDPARGAVAEQVGSLVGDLWGLGTPQGIVNTFLLAFENAWKAGPPINKKDDPRRVLYDLAVQHNWRGDTIDDFFDFAQEHDGARVAIATFLETNRNFIVNYHRYPDDRVNELLAAGKLESATLQENLGRAVLANRVTLCEAFQCSLIYARTRPGWEHQTSLLPRTPFTPADIAKIVLTRNTIDELKNPVPAQAFFDRYMAELDAAKYPKTQ